MLAHARITVDASAAAELPGVHVFTGADVDIGPFGPPPFEGMTGDEPAPRCEGRRSLRRRDRRGRRQRGPRRPGRTRRSTSRRLRPAAGRGQAAGCGEGRGHCSSRRPARISPYASARRSTTRRSSTAATPSSPGTLLSQRMAPCPLEPRSAAAVRGADGRITAWLSTQAPHQDQHGAGRGARARSSADPGRRPRCRRRLRREAARRGGDPVAWLAPRLGRPVRWTETRSESMVALQHGRAPQLEFTIGGTRDGRILAYRLDVLQDAGAYPVLGAFLPNLTRLMASGVYAIPRIEFEGASVVTNTTPITAFRGAGRPGGAARRSSGRSTCSRPRSASTRPRCAGGTSSRRTRSRTRPPRRDLRLRRLRGRARPRARRGRLRRAARRAGEAARAGDREQIGIGVAPYIEITNPIAETEFGHVEIAEDGRRSPHRLVLTRPRSRETFAQIASDRLGHTCRDRSRPQGDTDDILKGTGTYGLEVGPDRRNAQLSSQPRTSSRKGESSRPTISRRARRTSGSRPRPAASRS